MSEAESILSEIEREFIQFFVNAAQAIGLPRSVGEIYGLFFASEQPLALDDVIQKLRISKGSASQGIRFLKCIDALKSTYQPGDRREHHLAELSLRRIADGLIREKIAPQLKEGVARLKNLKPQGTSSDRSDYNSKLKNIEAWSQKAEMLLPFVSNFLSVGDKTTPNHVVE